MRVVVGFLVAAGTLLAGCGPNCQMACDKIYSESECDVKVPGQTQEAMYDRCVDDCEWALDRPGELEGYDPEVRHTSGERIELTTDKQAAVWMDCVMETACEDLLDGYCAPI